MTVEYHCGKCNAQVQRHTRTCPSCGVLLMGIRCSNCYYTGDESKFVNDTCPRCGSLALARFGTASYSLPTMGARGATRQPLSVPEFLAQILVALACGAVGIGLSILVGHAFFAFVGLVFMGFIIVFSVDEVRTFGWRRK